MFVPARIKTFERGENGNCFLNTNGYDLSIGCALFICPFIGKEMQPPQNDSTVPKAVAECSWETVENYEVKQCLTTAIDDSAWDQMSEWWLAECEDEGVLVNRCSAKTP
jgi:hypothetical protein